MPALRTILDPTAAKANAKALFGKEELAAILRFGAEELFKVGEHSAEVVKVEEKRLMEESIDAILERAEVGVPGSAGGGGGGLAVLHWCGCHAPEYCACVAELVTGWQCVAMWSCGLRWS